MPRRLAAGNWKMNGTRGNLSELDALMARHPAPSVDLLLCPPATLVTQAADRVAGHPMLIGAQDCHPARPVPILAICRLRFWPMPGPGRSFSGIPRGGTIIMKPML